MKTSRRIHKLSFLLFFLITAILVNAQNTELSVLQKNGKERKANKLLQEMDEHISVMEFEDAIEAFEEAIPYMEQAGMDEELFEGYIKAIYSCLQAPVPSGYFQPFSKPERQLKTENYLIKALSINCDLPFSPFRPRVLSGIEWILEQELFLGDPSCEYFLEESRKWLSLESNLHKEDKTLIAKKRDEVIHKKYHLPGYNQVSSKDDYVHDMAENISLLEDMLNSFYLDELLQVESLIALRLVQLYDATGDTTWSMKAHPYLQKLIFLFKDYNNQKQPTEYNFFIAYLNDRYNATEYLTGLDTLAILEQLDTLSTRDDFNNCNVRLKRPFFDLQVKVNVNTALGLINSRRNKYDAFYYFYTALYSFERSKANIFERGQFFFPRYQADQYYHWDIEFQTLAFYMSVNFDIEAMEEIAGGYYGHLETLKKIQKEDTGIHVFTHTGDCSVPIEYLIECNERNELFESGVWKKSSFDMYWAEPHENIGFQECFKGDVFLYGGTGTNYDEHVFYALRKEGDLKCYIGKEGQKIDLDTFLGHFDLTVLDTSSLKYKLLIGQANFENAILDLDESNWEGKLEEIYSNFINLQIEYLKENKVLPTYKLKNVSHKEIVFKLDNLPTLLEAYYWHSIKRRYIDGKCIIQGTKMFSEIVDILIEHNIWMDLDFLSLMQRRYDNIPIDCLPDSLTLESVEKLADHYIFNIDNLSEHYDSRNVFEFKLEKAHRVANREYDNGDYEQAAQLYKSLADTIIELAGANRPALRKAHFPKFLHALFNTKQYDNVIYYFDVLSECFVMYPLIDTLSNPDIGLLQSVSLETNFEANNSNELDRMLEMYSNQESANLLDRTILRVLNETKWLNMSYIDKMLSNSQTTPNNLKAALFFKSIYEMHVGRKQSADAFYKKGKEIILQTAQVGKGRDFLDDITMAREIEFYADFYMTFFGGESWSDEQVEFFKKEKGIEALQRLLVRIDKYKLWEEFVLNFESIIESFRSAAEIESELDAHYLWFKAKSEIVGVDNIDGQEAQSNLRRMEELVDELKKDGEAEYSHEQILVMQALFRRQESLNVSLEEAQRKEIKRRIEIANLADSLEVSLVKSDSLAKALTISLHISDSLKIAANKEVKFQTELRETSDWWRNTAIIAFLLLAIGYTIFFVQSKKQKKLLIKNGNKLRDQLTENEIQNDALNYQIDLAKKRKKILEEQNIKIQRQQKELNHRVTNNLRNIGSILYQRREKKTNELVKLELAKIKEFIDSVLRIQGFLQKGDNSGSIDLSYIEELAGLSSGLANVECEPEVQSGISLDYDSSYDIGVIVNEVITNSGKHAFGDSPNRRVFLRLFKSGHKTATLEVGDYGSGFPDLEKTLKKSDGRSMGMTLVRQCGKNLDKVGAIIKNTRKGMICKVNFEFKNSEL